MLHIKTKTHFIIYVGLYFFWKIEVLVLKMALWNTELIDRICLQKMGLQGIRWRMHCISPDLKEDKQKKNA